MSDQPTLLTTDSRGRVTLPAKIFKHTQYLLRELPDGALEFTPVQGSERS